MSQRGSKVSKRVPPLRAKGSDTAKIAKTTKARKRKGGKTGKHGKRTKKSQKEQELEPITPFNRGLSIGVKFAGLTACVVGLFMGLLGWLTYSISARNLDQQITEQGVSIVSTLEKAVDKRFWIAQEPRQVREGEKQPMRTEKGHEETREQLVPEWENRLQGIVDESGGKVVAIVIFNKKSDGSLERVVQYPKQQLAITNQKEIKEGLDEDSKVHIYDGRVQGKLVRQFDKDIDVANDLKRDEEVTQLIATLKMQEQDGADEAEVQKTLTRLNELTGEDFLTHAKWSDWRKYDNPPLINMTGSDAKPSVSVFIEASRLDDVKQEMRSRIAVVTLCGAIAGILLTVLISAVLTGPIRELESDIAEVAEGNLSHQSRVRSKDEIGALAHVFNIMTRNLRTAQSNAVERQAFERELNIAKEIQEKLLPERIPAIPGMDIHSHYKSAKEVGGDYYDFIVIDQNHLGIIVADVAGKGIPGAMVMTMARSLVRLASVRNVSPSDTFKKVNRILAKDIRRGMFVTAAYMVLNVKSKTLRVASAGHNPVVLFRAKTGEIELIKPKGIALGFDKGTIFDNNIKEAEVVLQPGDRIVTYTDGVNEAMNNDSEEFGDDRFYELTKRHARKSSKEFVEAVVSALDEHRADAEQSDDITITTLSVKGKAKA